MIPCRIAGTGSLLPGRRVSTEEVVARAWPGGDATELFDKTGIRARHWDEAGEWTVAALAAETVRRALAAAGMETGELRRIILASSVGFDFHCPATANALCEILGLRNSCDCFDLSNACTGWLTGMDIAARGAATGSFPTAVVATELLYRWLSPEDPRPFSVFGDGSGAAIVDRARAGEGMLGIAMGNDGFLRRTVTLDLQPPPPAAERALLRFGVPSRQVADEAMTGIATCAGRALDEAGLSIRDVDWVLVHQPNGKLLQRFCETLGVPPERAIPVVEEIGSVAAASVPISLDRLARSGRLRPGQRVLMAAVGGGLSYGALVYQA